MIAAPIWAVMHASPDGHEWSGKGAQGYMVILGMMLRPTLMIFGLVGSLILVNIMILLMKTMFGLSAGLVDNTAGVGPIAMIVMMFLYVWLAIQIVNQSLTMITEVPSHIMRWIGGPTGDPFGSNVASSGASFVGGVMGKGEGAAKAGVAASKGIRDQAKLDEKATKTEDAANKRNNDLIGAIHSMGGNKGGGGTDTP